MKKQTFTVPVWALSYLANGDKTGLTLADLALCRKFEKENRVYAFLDAGSEEVFTFAHSLAGEGRRGLGSTCVECTFHVRYTSDELFNRIVCRVDTSWGAPMGRANKLVPLDEHGFPDRTKTPVDWNKTPYFDRRVPMTYDGVYDQGGAYWSNNKLRVRFSKNGEYWQFYDEGTKI